MSIGTITLHGTNVALTANTTVVAVEAQSGHIEVSFDINFLNPDFEQFGEVKGAGAYKGNSTLKYRTFDITTIGYDTNGSDYYNKLEALENVLSMPYLYLEINDYYSASPPLANTVAAPIAITYDGAESDGAYKVFSFQLSSVIPNQW